MSSQETPALKQHYIDVVAPGLKKSQGYKNDMEIPVIEKVVLNMGINASADKSVLEEAVKNLSAIAGQAAVRTYARKSIANFKLREGMPIGCKVTLRGNRMWDFLYRLLAVGLPSIRDFRGVHSRFDGNGNYSLGVTDITIFPEIATDTLKYQSGLEFTIVTSAATNEEGKELLTLLGMPFRKQEKKEETTAA
ncbi:50S ribosomal protein L5 [Pelagicoccus sp. NFK12]|uniref:Large ribosomal subunit protein uL5 n=1 Tax=Pelagicoccus enzymogenes TaxID=2773457 RepID=A0A927FDS8_9BACT|nr:50S ribosomal protein L5 [Pelagicoccus enzymogenes]MBD5782546.1 50S ribosomal protein L5 [Pelagicoccus enzymogenes]MDQ8199540.1 50S ribosomal protein L5 [Pelagicoccus enzymogenes]